MPEETVQTEVKPRRTYVKLTKAQLDSIREACRRPDLRKKDGTIDTKLIAELCGVDKKYVLRMCEREPDLRAATDGATPERATLANIDLIDGQPLPHINDSDGGERLTAEQYEEYQRLLRQNRAMESGDIERFGASPESAAKMARYAKKGTMPLNLLMNYSAGQLATNMEDIDDIIRGDVKMIKEGKYPTELDAEGNEIPQEFLARKWRSELVSMMNLHLSMTVHQHKIRAMAIKGMTELMRMKGATPDAEKKGHYTPRS